MASNFFAFKYMKFFSFFFVFIILLLFFISFSIIQINEIYKDSSFIFSGFSDYCWPLPDYTYISSPFGYRNSPTSGASSYHSGIDIPAPEGTKIYSVCDGIVSFASCGAGGGYTIVVENNDLKISYCHVSPNFIVFRNQEVKKGEFISNVGPKNVYGISNNPYKDSYGNPTNGATTGCHLHLSIKVNGKPANPLSFFDNTKE